MRNLHDMDLQSIMRPKSGKATTHWWLMRWVRVGGNVSQKIVTHPKERCAMPTLCKGRSQAGSSGSAGRQTFSSRIRSMRPSPQPGWVVRL